MNIDGREKNGRFIKGHKTSDVVRRKISKTEKGKHQSEEAKRKMSESHKGLPCSDETKGKMRIAHSGEKNHNWKGGETKIICAFCGKEKKIRPAKARNGGNFFCSKLCCYEARKGITFSPGTTFKRGQTAGEKNNSWKGGVTPIRKLVRSSVKYAEWRQRCFVRDDFTCHRCGKQGGDLNVHHRKTFEVLLKEAMNCLPLFSPYEAAMIYTPLWNTANGITLCKKCHKSPKYIYKRVVNQ